MAWYWEVVIGVVSFNMVFVLLAWSAAVMRERKRSIREVAGEEVYGRVYNDPTWRR